MCSNVKGVNNLDQISVTTAVAAELLGIAEGTLRNWRSNPSGNIGPTYTKVGGRVLYPVAELKAFIERHSVPSVR